MGLTVVETAKDLKTIPLRALVAYAARCARRVQAQYVPPDDQPDADACRAAIDAAIQLAERFAAGKDLDPAVVAHAEEATVRAMLAVSTEDSGNSSAAYSANAAYATISAAHAGLEALYAIDPSEAADKVADPAAIAVDAASAIQQDVAAAARFDWEMLHRLRLGRFPGVGDPVNASESGILGPLYCRAGRSTKGKPSSRRESPASPETRAVDGESIRSRDDSSTHQVERELQQLRRKQEELQALATELQVERDCIEADRAALSVVNDDLERRRKELDRRSAVAPATVMQDAEAEAHAVRVAALEESSQQVERDRKALQEERERMQAASARLAEKEADLHEQKALIDAERQSLALQSRENEKAAADLRQQLEQLRFRQEELTAAERAVQENNNRSAEHSHCEASFETREREIVLHAMELEAREAAVADRQSKSEQTLQDIKDREAALSAERKDLEQLRRELAEQRPRIERDAAELSVRAAEVQADSERVRAERDAIQQSLDEVSDQRAALESARRNLDSDLQKAQEAAKEIEHDKRRFKESRIQYKAEQQLINQARSEIEAARAELRQQSEKFEAGRVSFMEEKARVTKKEADIHRALKQLRDTRKRLQPQDDPFKSWRLQQEPREAVADLQAVLSRLQDERHRLKVEREQLAEVFALVSRSRRQVAGSEARSPRATPPAQTIEGPRLRMILEPGSAACGKVAELFSELSLLNLALGGRGVEFVVNECRIWSLSSFKAALGEAGLERQRTAGEVPQPLGPAAGQRSLVEVYAVPAGRETGGEFSPANWDRFTASLFMVLRLDAGQTSYFDLSQSTPPEHPAFRLAADAARRAADRPASRAETSIDAVNGHLQKIEELRRKLEREDALILELAPAVVAEPAPSDMGPAIETKCGRRWISFRTAVILAAVSTLGAGVAICLQFVSAR